MNQLSTKRFTELVMAFNKCKNYLDFHTLSICISIYLYRLKYSMQNRSTQYDISVKSLNLDF